MRFIPAFFGFIFFVSLFCITPVAGAVTFTFYDVNDPPDDVWVDNNGFLPDPEGWFNLAFPDSADGTYGNGSFEYDDYASYAASLDSFVDNFVITLYGHGDNTNNVDIDLFLSFEQVLDVADITSPVYVGSYDVPQNDPFTLSLDIKNDLLIYNLGQPTQDSVPLMNVGLSSFLGGSENEIDMVWIGYGCHFFHDKTEISLTASGVSIPEPTTVSLFGLGLIAVGILRRRR